MFDSVSHRRPIGFSVWPQFQKLQKHSIKWWSVDNSAPRFMQTSHTSENKYDKTIQKFVKDFWSILGRYHVYLWTTLCWKKVIIMRSPLLQQSCNKYLPFSFSPVTTCFPITLLAIFVSVPTCALKSLIRTVDLVGDTRRRASFTSSTKSWGLLFKAGHPFAMNLTRDNSLRESWCQKLLTFMLCTYSFLNVVFETWAFFFTFAFFLFCSFSFFNLFFVCHFCDRTL